MYQRVNRFNKKNSYTRAKNIPFLVFDCLQDDVKKIKCTGIPGSGIGAGLIICAIDPAIKNCAVRIEDENKKTLLQTKFDFVSKDNPARTCYYENLNIRFKEILPMLSKCHFILIESQMPINTEAVRISQAIITFLMTAFSLSDSSHTPVIIELDAKLKSSVIEPTLGKIKKYDLKKWAANKGLEILKENGDEETYNFVLKQKKKDDHGDVICYIYAWRKIMNDMTYGDILYHY